MDQLYFDGMTICSYMGFPDLFITFTCNPKWPEITRLLAKLKLSPTERPDIVSRVFKIKFEQLLTDLTKNHLLGKTIACKPSLFVILFLFPQFGLFFSVNKCLFLYLQSCIP